MGTCYSLKPKSVFFFLFIFDISELFADSYLLITEPDDTEQQPGFQLPLPTSELTARMQTYSSTKFTWLSDMMVRCGIFHDVTAE